MKIAAAKSTDASDKDRLATIQTEMCGLWTNRQKRNESTADGEMARGVAVYSRLIEIGRVDLLASIYPLIETLLAKNFRELALDYFEARPAPHFNLNRAAQGFADYLRQDRAELLKRYPFLAELADYEWIELEALESAGESLPSKCGPSLSIKMTHRQSTPKRRKIAPSNLPRLCRF